MKVMLDTQKALKSPVSDQYRNNYDRVFRKPSVAFATKCWAGDFHKFLAGEFDRKADSCQYPFDEKWLMLNNEVPEGAFKDFKGKTIDVLKEQAETLEFFDLTESDFKTDKGNGYWYSIAELTAIRLAEGFDYLCWVQSDCIIEPASDWITRGIEILEENPLISIISPGSKVNTYGEIDAECSDQAFLIRVPEFRKRIYNYTEPNQDNYPSYGGQSFEYKVGQYLKNTGQRRMILYEHNLEHK